MDGDIHNSFQGGEYDFVLGSKNCCIHPCGGLSWHNVSCSTVSKSSKPAVAGRLPRGSLGKCSIHCRTHRCGNRHLRSDDSIQVWRASSLNWLFFILIFPRWSLGELAEAPPREFFVFTFPTIYSILYLLQGCTES